MAELSLFISQFHFLRPLWLLGLIAVIGYYLLMRFYNRTAGEWERVIAPELIPFLVERGEQGNTNLRPWVVIAGVVAVIALAGPSWSKKPVPIHKTDQALIVLFDLSPSMLAADLKPDRLTRARLKTIDLLNAYDEGTAALIAFAGDAHVVTPLTDDTNTIISQLPVLHPNIIPIAGSNPEAALALATELAKNAGHTEADILLVTDGLTTGARENLESALRDTSGLRLSILGVGTAEGAPIPLNEYGFARDSQGSIVIAKLHADELSGLASRTGGVYHTLSATDDDVDALVGSLSERSGKNAQALERDLDIWKDQGIWLVLVLIPLGAMLFRRNLIVTALLVPLLHTPDSQASVWDDLWQTPDQQGYKALNQGNPEEAQSLFNDPSWKGVAAAKAGNYPAAVEQFSSVNHADGHYNRGNALAKAGNLKEALDAYNRALALEPDMEDAKYNKEIIEKLLQQQNNKQAQNSETDSEHNQEQQQSGNSNSQEQSQNGNQQQQSQGSEGKPDNQTADSRHQGERSSQENRQQQDANQTDRNSSEGQKSGEDQGSEQHEGSGDSTQGAQDVKEEKQPSSQADNATGNESGQNAENTIGGEADNLSDEKRQNAEEWLRRVPDDPGGLLRNKFDYESRQRFREERSARRTPPGAYSEERW